jgi:hypothetical protein
MGKLNAARLRTLVDPGTYADAGGLYLQVRGPHQRSWLYRYKLHGRGHWMGLGTAHDVSLAEARERAQAARKLVRQGVDPIERRKADRGTLSGHTFAEVADLYIAAHLAGWRSSRHAEQWRNTIDTHVVPVFGNKPIATIDVADVMRRCSRCGRSYRSRRIVCVGESSPSSISPRRGAGAPVKIRPAGAPTSITCCRQSPSCDESNTMRRFPGRRSGRS